MLQTKEQDKNPQLREWTCSLEEKMWRETRGEEGWDQVILPPTEVKLMYPLARSFQDLIFQWENQDTQDITTDYFWYIWNEEKIGRFSSLWNEGRNRTSNIFTGTIQYEQSSSLRETWICLVLKPEKNISCEIHGWSTIIKQHSIRPYYTQIYAFRWRLGY